MLSFAWNLLISMTFQYVGFMLTYLMHTTHAAKYGSRAGLGITLIQYGLFSREDDAFGGGNSTESSGWGQRLSKRFFARSPPDLFSTTPEATQTETGAPLPQDDPMYLGTSARDWVSFFLMTAGAALPSS